MESSLVSQGLDLMLMGMGTVFAFLTTLVFVTGLMSRIVNSFAPDAAAAVVPTAPAAPSTTNVDAETLEVITEAIRQHRSRQK